MADIEGEPFYLYNAHTDKHKGEPGKILAKRNESILIGSGNGSVWIGFLKKADKAHKFKSPATHVLEKNTQEIQDLSITLNNERLPLDEYDEIHYQQSGKIGVLTFEFYNGAMSTQQCIRMSDALRYAKEQDTEVLVIKGGINAFSNGIHLNTIEAAKDPAMEGWLNIQAIDDVCLEILTAKQWTIAAVTGSSGAGGIMMALTANSVLARKGIVLNPHYKTMGLYGSEYWTYSLPLRVGEEKAMQLTQECMPISSECAVKIGMVDETGPRDFHEFSTWIMKKAEEAIQENKIHSKPYFNAEKAEKCRIKELEEMKEDLLNDRNNFSGKRNCFVMKKKASQTPERLIASWTKESIEL